MKTCRLLVSVRAIIASGGHAEICSGHKLTVTNLRDAAGFALCETQNGEEVWIPEQYVSHATLSLAGEHPRSPATNSAHGTTQSQVNNCAGQPRDAVADRQGELSPEEAV